MCRNRTNLCGSPKPCQRIELTDKRCGQLPDSKVGAVVSKTLTGSLALLGHGEPVPQVQRNQSKEKFLPTEVRAVNP